MRLPGEEGAVTAFAAAAAAFFLLVAALVLDLGTLHMRAALAYSMADAGSLAAALTAEPKFGTRPYTYYDENGVPHTVMVEVLEGFEIDPAVAEPEAAAAVARAASAHNDEVGSEELKPAPDEGSLDGENYTYWASVSFPAPDRARVTVKIRLPCLFSFLPESKPVVTRTAEATPVAR